MGSFGIQFSESFSRANDNAEPIEELNKKSEGFLQKSLAYTSYYTMLFVAYAMITPEKMEIATNAVTNLLA